MYADKVQVNMVAEGAEDGAVSASEISDQSLEEAVGAAVEKAVTEQMAQVQKQLNLITSMMQQAPPSKYVENQNSQAGCMPFNFA